MYISLNTTEPVTLEKTTCNLFMHGGLRDCGVLSDPANGQVEISATTEGSVATYSCDPGFALDSSVSSRTCQTTGRWSGELPTCERKTI